MKFHLVAAASTTALVSRPIRLKMIESSFSRAMFRSRWTFPMTFAILPILQLLRENLPMLKEQYKIRSLGLFGSYVRGEQKKTATLIFSLNSFETPGLFTFIRLEEELSRIIGCKADLVMKNSFQTLDREAYSHGGRARLKQRDYSDYRGSAPSPP